MLININLNCFATGTYENAYSKHGEIIYVMPCLGPSAYQQPRVEA